MLTEDDLSKLRADHKRIVHVVGKDGAWEVVLRKPNRAEYKFFRQKLFNDELRAVAHEDLARTIVVYPTREAFDALLEEYPAIAEACAKKIAELTGFAVEESGK